MNKTMYQLGDKIGTTTVVGVHTAPGHVQDVEFELQDGPYRLFKDDLPADRIDKSTVDILDQVEFNNPLDILRPGWLEAVGHEGFVWVMRSPILRTTDDWYEPVREWIESHGLVLAARETVVDRDWMHGEYESSLYAVPDSALA